MLKVVRNGFTYKPLIHQGNSVGLEEPEVQVETRSVTLGCKHCSSTRNLVQVQTILQSRSESSCTKRTVNVAFVSGDLLSFSLF